MSFVAAISKIDFPYRVDQKEVKKYAQTLFSPHFPQISRVIDVFDNTEIQKRNFCKPLNFYSTLHSFEQHNNEYVQCSLEYSVKAIEECLVIAKIDKEDITDIIFVSSTGLATPSLDALIINRLRLNPYINRTPVFGLGCAGGVSGVAKANALALANQEAIVLVVTVELCSLTFLKNDFSKSNFVASSLFSDGVAACIIKGDKHNENAQVKITGSGSKLYYDSLDVMGWEFLDSGFKVLFSQDIPAIIKKYVRDDVLQFLARYNLDLGDIKNFIFHPGGKKVINAYIEALGINDILLRNTRQIMNDYGNMSSATVLYVLERFIKQGFNNGHGLMLALGPGFSSEMVLLSMNNN